MDFGGARRNPNNGDELNSLVEDNIFEETGSALSSPYELKLKQKLRFHFMNPLEKWETKKRFPYKFIVQVIKIVLVTSLLGLFGHTRYVHVNYVGDNKVSFSHLFLKNWDATEEVDAYPPSIGPFAIYKVSEFFEAIDYAIVNYCNLGQAIGSYSYPSEDNQVGPVELCMFKYKEGSVFGFNESYVFNSDIVENCWVFKLSPSVCSNFSSQNILNDSIVFSALLQTKLTFGIKTVNLKSAGPITPPDCYFFNVSILFDNQDLDGQTLLSLHAEAHRLECQGQTDYKTNNRLDSALRSLLNASVIVICMVSFVLCSRAVYRAQLLKYETMKFFRLAYGRELSSDGRWEFLNLWYVLIIVNDVLLIVGSSIKERIEHHQYLSDRWDFCSVLLGTGNLFVWFGVLRYFGFFRSYNIVILTLKKATPEIFRSMMCAILLFAGFSFCGWLVLGPYHIKFLSLSTTTECLFALINGDDIFATFSLSDFKNSIMLWWFARIYLYAFISLFIYVVIALFLSVISDSYDTIKQYYVHGFPTNDLQQFMAVQDDEEQIFCRSDSSSSLGDVVGCCCRTTKMTLHTLTCRSYPSDGSGAEQADIM